MKYLILTLTLILTTISFSQKNKKFKPEKNMVQLHVLSSEALQMKVGQKFYYSGHTHGSVGEQYSISTSSGFDQVDKHFVYDDIKKSEMSGGDGGTMTMVYKALKPGDYTIVVKDLFRGDVKNTYEIKITVTE